MGGKVWFVVGAALLAFSCGGDQSSSPAGEETRTVESSTSEPAQGSVGELTAESGLADLSSTMASIIGPSEDFDDDVRLLLPEFPELQWPVPVEIVSVRAKLSEESTNFVSNFTFSGEAGPETFSDQLLAQGWTPKRLSDSSDCYDAPAGQSGVMCVDKFGSIENEKLAFNYNSEEATEVSRHGGWIGDFPLLSEGEQVQSLVSATERVGGRITMEATIKLDEVADEQQLLTRIKEGFPTEDYSEFVDIPVGEGVSSTISVKQVDGTIVDVSVNSNENGGFVKLRSELPLER